MHFVKFPIYIQAVWHTIDLTVQHSKGKYPCTVPTLIACMIWFEYSVEEDGLMIAIDGIH